MYLTKPAAVGIQFLGAIFLIAGLALTLYVSASNAALFMAVIGVGLIVLGHPRRRTP